MEDAANHDAGSQELRSQMAIALYSNIGLNLDVLRCTHVLDCEPGF